MRASNLLLPAFLGICAALLPPARALAAEPGRLAVTFFNIRYFGMNGDANGPVGQDTRVATLKAHLEANHLLGDVLVFEEIVDVKLLTEQVLGARYSCQSYDNADPKHQHVVLCAEASKFRLDRDAGDDDFTYADVSLGRLRPAVHGLVSAKDGGAVVHVVGLHLKAQKTMSATRAEQVKLLAADLRTHDGDGVPTLVVGDMNTFNDDPAAFQAAFDAAGLALHEVPNPAAATWRGSLTASSKLDRAWASDSATVIGTPVVTGPCNDGQVTRAQLQKYYDEVSDHCAVALVLATR